MALAKIILFEIILPQTLLSLNRCFLQRPENIDVKRGSRTEHESNSPITFVLFASISVAGILAATAAMFLTSNDPCH